MLIDTPQITEGSSIINATVPSGTAYPATAKSGELYFVTGVGLHVYTGEEWVLLARNSLLTAHVGDDERHVKDQNAIAKVEADLSKLSSESIGEKYQRVKHENDNDRHLSLPQKNLLDGIKLTSTIINGLPEKIDAFAAKLPALENPQPALSQSRCVTKLADVADNVILNFAGADELRVSMTGDADFELSGAVDGQICTVKIKQSSGGRNLINFKKVRFSKDIPHFVASTEGDSADRVTFIYDADDDLYDLISVVRGF